MIIKRDQSSLESDKEKKMRRVKEVRIKEREWFFFFFFFKGRLDKKNVEFKPQT